MTRKNGVGSLRMAVAGMGVACAAVLAGPGTVWADDVPAASQPAASASGGGDEIPTYDLAMMGIEKIGLKNPFDAAHLKLSGFIEQSFTANLDAPPDRMNNFRLFDDRSNDYRMNQLDLRLQRDLVPYKAGDKDGDVGFLVEGMYGSDARFIHEAGLSGSQTDANYQFDPVQFYGLIRLPVGNGLLLKGGKFVTPNGAETIDPRSNALYSHTYLFNFAIPFTHTGGYIEYPVIPDAFTAYYAPVLGWDVWTDNNSAMSHLFGGYGSIGDFTYGVNFNLGPEATGDNTDYRFLTDVVVTYKWTDEFSTTVNVDYGYEGKVSAIIPGTSAQWYGVAVYGTYQFSSQIKGTVRGEYFRDNDGFRTGSGVGTDLYEVTVGVDIIPCKHFGNLRVRPEIRWDHCGGQDKLFKAGTKDNQYTLGLDVIIGF